MAITLRCFASVLAAWAVWVGQAQADDTIRQFDSSTNSWIRADKEVSVHSRRLASPVPREVVPYETEFAPGTIIIETGERRLYLVRPDGKTAIRYGIGVGREGFAWRGRERISRKAEWPSWRPPAEMLRREAEKGHIIPSYVEGGVDNPLGARALYLGDTLYRIHGTNEPWTIGKAVSSGCIRMTNDDVIELYQTVSIGTRVVVR